MNAGRPAATNAAPTPDEPSAACGARFTVGTPPAVVAGRALMPARSAPGAPPVTPGRMLSGVTPLVVADPTPRPPSGPPAVSGARCTAAWVAPTMNVAGVGPL